MASGGPAGGAGRPAAAAAGAEPKAGDAPRGGTLVQYKPHDRHSAMEAHARSLEERHRDESAGHAASTQSLENVRQTHDEEQRLLLAALLEETARTRSRRQEVQK